MKLAIPQSNAIIFGFDSAWADKNPGAICAIAFDEKGEVRFEEPERVRFGEAVDFIGTNRRGYDFSLVAIDQPTIVPNESGSRPIDRAAASLVSFVGGGVQPANRSKREMFGDGAPIWRFLRRVGAEQNPQAARTESKGHFLIEVFPALALPSLHADFARRWGAPKYNPGNKKFQREDWQAVAEVVAEKADQMGISGLASWAKGLAKFPKPRKVHQDQLDSALCALIGLIWRAGPAGDSAMIGDLETGYMITPVSDKTIFRIKNGAYRTGSRLFLAP